MFYLIYGYRLRMQVLLDLIIDSLNFLPLLWLLSSMSYHSSNSEETNRYLYHFSNCTLWFKVKDAFILDPGKPALISNCELFIVSKCCYSKFTRNEKLVQWMINTFITSCIVILFQYFITIAINRIC